MKRSIPRLACVVAAGTVLIAGCASVSAPFRSADARWADYKTWRTASDTPSTGASPGLGAVHKGPEGYRMVYVNNVGHDTLTGDGPYDYPVGTVMVKEQYDDEAAYVAGTDPDLTISVKVANGPVAKDNWQWADSYKATAADNAFCSGCHSIPFAKDFVFSNAAYLAANE